MSDPLQRVARGQPRRYTAQTHNEILEAVRKVRDGSTLGVDARIQSSENSLAILVRNDTGGDLAEWSTVRVAGLLSDLDEPAVVSARPIYSGALPASESDTIAILQSGAADGGIARATFQGHAVARVNVTDEGHGFAVPIVGDSDELASAAEGPVKILAKPSGTGVLVCAVLVGSGGGIDSASRLWVQITNVTPDSKGWYEAKIATFDPTDGTWSLVGDTIKAAPAVGETMEPGVPYLVRPSSDPGVFLVVADANEDTSQTVPVYFGGLLNTSGQVIKGVKEFRDYSKWRYGGASTSGTNIGPGFVQYSDNTAFHEGRAIAGPGIAEVRNTSIAGPITGEVRQRTMAGLDGNGKYFEFSEYVVTAGGLGTAQRAWVAEPGSLFFPQWATFFDANGAKLGCFKAAALGTHYYAQVAPEAARLYWGGVARDVTPLSDDLLGSLFCGGDFCLTFLTHYPNGPFGPRFGVDRYRNGALTRLWGIDRVFQPGDLPVVAGGIVVGYWRESGGREAPDPTDEDPTPDEPSLPIPDPVSITYDCVEGKCVAVVGTSGTYATLSACQAASCEGTPPPPPPPPPPPVPPVITWDCACVEDHPYDGSAFRGVAVPNYEGTGKYTDNLAANQGCFDWGLENCKAESKAWYQVCPEGKVGAAVCEQLTAEEAAERGIVSGPHADKSTCEGAFRAFPAFCSEDAFRSGDVTVIAAAPATATAEKIPLPCVHRGESTGEQVQCRACINKTTEVFGCQVHGECTVDRSAYPRKFRVGGQLTFKEIPLCGSCKDRKEPSSVTE